MDTVVADPQSDNVFKFSLPLQVANFISNNKGSEQSKEVVYTFSVPLDVMHLTATSSSKPNDNSITGFGKQFTKSQNEWECDVCMITNKLEVNKCAACETPRKAMTQLNETPFGQQFRKPLDKWECDTCLIQNALESKKCLACETPRKVKLTAIPFGNSFKPISDNWECPTCMISNEFASDACIACKTKKLSTQADDVFRNIAAQQKNSKWECTACMTQNNNNCNKCVCCEQQKPGYKKVESTEKSGTLKFTFGFGDGTNAPTESELRKNEASQKDSSNFGYWKCNSCKNSIKNELDTCLTCNESKISALQFKFSHETLTKTPADVVFKALAFQQKASKWECSACMTQNDINKTVCACCEQPNPHTSVAAFKIYEPSNKKTTVATKFNFGFGPGAAAEEELKKVKSSVDVVDKKEEKGSKLGLSSNCTADDGFKILATQQKLSKWECNACMTQNDNNLLKCACCQQAKQDEELKETTKIEISATKFRFGFGNGVDAPTEEDLKKEMQTKSS